MAANQEADPPAIRQLLLQHSFLPLVSVQSTRSADQLLQRECGNALISALQVLRPYGNNAKFGIANQMYKITNTQLITRTYALFPVRFEPSLPELMAVQAVDSDKLANLFKVPLLEYLLRSGANGCSGDELYKLLFRKVVTSNTMVLFDTLNHPICHILVIDFSTDTAAALRLLIVEFRNFNFPKYFQLSDLLVHVIVLYDSQSVNEADVATFQSLIRVELSATSSAVPLFQQLDGSITLDLGENTTIEGQVQMLSLQQATQSEQSDLKVPKLLDTALRTRLYEFVSKVLIPHMERMVRTWDDLVLLPKKSITGRFFSASRKLFNSNEITAPGTYDHLGNFYNRLLAEQTIRKLADWLLLLKDFKYAYSTYDLIKKDYTNDKAWLYVAAAKEMCIVSLLLAQTQPITAEVPALAPDKNTLRKIRHDIVEPYMDNLTYTYKSRFNVKTYAIRAHLVVAELLLGMSVLFRSSWWSDLTEGYYIKSMAELDNSAENSVIRATLYERLGYVTSKNQFVSPQVSPDKESTEKGHYVNVNKIDPPPNNSTQGLTRLRKSALWNLLAALEWLHLDSDHVKRLLPRVTSHYNAEWCFREDGLLGKLEASVGATQ